MNQLSYTEEALWLRLHMVPEEETAYHIATAWRLTGVLDVDALRSAWACVVNRHEAFRTSFPLIGDEPHRAISERPNVPLEISSLAPGSGEPGPAALAALKKWAARSFDVGCGPLARAQLLKVDEGVHLLAFVCHHLVADGRSAVIIWDELCKAYESLARAQTPQLPAVPLQPSEFATRQRERHPPQLEPTEADHWISLLRGLEGGNRHSSETANPRASTSDAQLPHAASLAIRNLSRELGATPFALLVAAFLAVVELGGEERRVIVGIPVDTRSDPRSHRMVGHAVNTLPLVVCMEGMSTFRSLVEAVSEGLMDLLDNGEQSLRHIVQAVGGQAGLLSPYFAVVVGMPPSLSPRRRLGDMAVEPVPRVDLRSCPFDLNVQFEEHDEDVYGCQITFREDIHKAISIRTAVGALVDVLLAAQHDPDLTLASLVVSSARLDLAPLTTAGSATGDAGGTPSPGVPDDPLLRTVVSLFSELLQKDDVVADTDFFAEGGHSLLGLALSARLRKATGVHVTLRDVVTESTPRRLAATIRAKIEAKE